ncbi:MAG: tetratricopeptide repeat protein [Alphaproteobacteria bacterium]|nr:tetratricopeptide repeat protein [Alphaproteobacteria bacterium]
MRAIISGEAAVSAILGRTVQLRPLGAEPTGNLRLHDLARALGGCRDVCLVEVKDETEADAMAQQAWAADRALRFFLFLLDSEEEADELKEYAECLEELVEDKSTRLNLERRLLSNAIPTLIEINRINKALETCKNASDLFEFVTSLQPTITKITQAYDEVAEKSFGGAEDKCLCRESLTRDGTFRDLVIAIHEGRDINFLRLAVTAKHRTYAQALSELFSLLQPSNHKLPRPSLQEQEQDKEDDNFEQYDASREGDYEAFNRVRAQQRGIIERLKQHDFITAKRFADQLIAEQRRLSNKEHIAKSLCFLAQQAKQYEATELQLDWAAQANETDPSDPMTSGHLADAYIGAGNFVAAYAAIEQTERRGDALYAATSRARIRRMEGRFAEAYELYLAAACEHDANENVVHAWTGVAETLRDMGKFDDALVQYRALVERWPDDAGLRSGLASVLMEAGRYNDAIKEFNIALQYRGGIVAENGLATSYKLAGNFDRALEIYDSVLQYAPFSTATLCGRAEVFRANDDLTAALDAYKLAVERVSHNPRPFAGLGHVMEDLGWFEDARKVYSEGERRFPGDEFIAVGSARLLRREHKFQEALKAFDELAGRFPFNRWVKWARGDVLRSMGHPEAALQAMSSILEAWPDYSPAQTSKASLLIETGRYDEAIVLLDARDAAANPSYSSHRRAIVIFSAT